MLDDLALGEDLQELVAFKATSLLVATQSTACPSHVQIARGDFDAAIETYLDLITVDFSSRYNAFVDPRYVLRLAELGG